MLDANKATVLVSDLAIQRGFGIFDFLKIVNGRPVFLEDHLDRFYYSAGQIRMKISYERQALKAMLSELIKVNEMPLSGIKMILTGGYSADGYSLENPNLIISQATLTNYIVEPTEGLKLVSYPHQRQMAHIKTIDYLMAIWLQPYIKEHSANDVLYQQNNIVTECPRANFFIVTKDKKVITPANNMLKGIIRSQLFRHYAGEFNIVEQDITLKEVYAANEAFITSSTKNIYPVVAVDGYAIGDGSIGDVTRQLSGRLNKLIDQEIGG